MRKSKTKNEFVLQKTHQSIQRPSADEREREGERLTRLFNDVEAQEDQGDLS